MSAELHLTKIKLGDNADTSKNFVISTPVVADGTLTIERENGTDVLTIDASGNIRAGSACNLAGNGPAFSAYTSAAPLPSGSVVKPSLTERYDTGNAFTPNGSKFNPSVPGYYQFNLSFELAALMNAGYCGISVNNGAAFIKGAQGNLYCSTANALIYLNGTTDYVEAVVYQSSGASNNCTITFSGFLARAA